LNQLKVEKLVVKRGRQLQPSLLYSKCQSSIFLFADWSKPYHVLVHKTSCSLRALARGQPVNNEAIIDRSKIKPEVRRELFASTSKIKAKSFQEFLHVCRSVLLQFRNQGAIIQYF
jgi:hypothetical protein